jgi:hypothetical protein
MHQPGELGSPPATVGRAATLEQPVIVSMHVATGALAGWAARSPLGALALGPVTHLIGDRIPHQDIHSVPFEVRTGVGGVLALALIRGPLDPATIGAAAAAAPDLEHIWSLPRPGGRKLFPSHRFASWHREGGVPVWLQLLVAAAILGWLLAPGGARARRWGRQSPARAKDPLSMRDPSWARAAARWLG